MIREGFTEKEDEQVSDIINVKQLLSLGLATRVDALAVGVSFDFLRVDIIEAVWIIGFTTFVLSFIGVKSGHFLGQNLKVKPKFLAV
ncbi:hypothetical protein BKK56_05450 [Rodentibacter genomosp. 2]|uniref:manganese efflux pump MntP n=1 Tax=Rodentibacter genomosp. 2 TaxID=1908266 RepID=UPI0009C6B700|nr:hypothetical protein BKK56_05450 [Rodentibacter genomosp. 2]